MKFTVSTVAPGVEAIAFDLGNSEPIDDQAELDRLANLSDVEYDRERKAAADRLGIRAGTLDNERAKRTESPEAESGLCVDPEPWPEPVYAATLLNGLASVARRYVVLPDYAGTLAALWVLHTHAHDAAEHSPVLAVTSPEKRCGKTTLLNFLGQLVRRPLPSANITAPALFRATEKYQPTLLIDEADTFLRQSDELRGVLNSGHSKASAYVIRTVGEDYDPKPFCTWAPKAIALIGNMPPTLTDRAVLLSMRRKHLGETVDRLRSNDQELLRLSRQASRWASEVELGTDPEIPEGLHDRAADNWRPLLAIADSAGGEWPSRAREAALRLSGGADDDSARAMLLADMQRLFTERDEWPSTELVDRLIEMEHRPWPEWRKGRPITTRQVARLLEDFGISPHRIQADTRRVRGYRRRQFDDAFSRYLAPDLSKCPESHNGAGCSDFQSVPEDAQRDRSKTPENRTVEPNGTDGHLETLGGADDAVEGEL